MRVVKLGYLLLIFLAVTTIAFGGYHPKDVLSHAFDFIAGFFDGFIKDPCPDKMSMKIKAYNLRNRLRKDLISQPLVEESLSSMVESHLIRTAQKPLVISMHGWTGGGKNYVTEILVETLYEKGLKNDNVHFFSGRLHFPLSTEAAVIEYKVNLHNWIRGNVTQCGLSTFIFDEIDKIPVEVFDAIKPFLDYHSTLNRVDYRNTIFIFISNVGGNMITKKYVELWESGVSRDNMKYKSFEPVLRKILYNTEGAFERSSILEDHLVSLYLPFFPMEKEHVVECIRREMIRQLIPVTDEKIAYVLDAMEFFHDRFSISGCKRVNDQVALLKYLDKDEL